MWQPYSLRDEIAVSARMPIYAFRFVHGDSELVLAEACRNVRVGSGVDVGVHADGKSSLHAAPAAIASISANSASDSQLKP